MSALLIFTLSLWRDFREHRLLALRAVVTGTVALWLVWRFLALPLANLDDWLFVTGLADIRFFWRGGRAFFSHFLIGGGLNLLAGWIVGRTHPRYPVAMVCVFFTALVIIVDLPRVVPAFIGASAQTTDVFFSFLGIAFIDFVFLRLPILIGGFWSARGVTRRESCQVVIE